MELHYFSAFSIGLAGAGHCLGMCGGIAAALNLGSNQAGPVTTLAYHSGRLLSYTLLGALLGAMLSLVNLAQATLFLRYLAGFMLIGMGLYIGNWWLGLSALERLGARLWRPVQKLTVKLLPIRHWYHAALLGLGWGLMPCGLIYSSLAWAATAQSATQSALLMFCFGLGTLPAMLTLSFSANSVQHLLRKRGLKTVIALLLITSGVWTLYLVNTHGSHVLHKAQISTPAMDHSQHNKHD